MRLIVYDSKAGDDIVRLALFEEDGCIMLRAVDPKGVPMNRGTILVITKSLELYRSPDISGNLRFKKDHHGRILITDKVD